MDVTRRHFIQISGATAAGLAVSGLGFDLRPVKAHAQMLKTRYAKESTSICPYCAVGCGIIVHTSKKGDGRVINIEGDPDHVINRRLSVLQRSIAGPIDRKRSTGNPADVSGPVFQGMEKGLMGLGPDGNRQARQSDPGCRF